jgi:hypothetical protein
LQGLVHDTPEGLLVEISCPDCAFPSSLVIEAQGKLRWPGDDEEQTGSQQETNMGEGDMAMESMQYKIDPFTGKTCMVGSKASDYPVRETQASLFGWGEDMEKLARWTGAPHRERNGEGGEDDGAATTDGAGTDSRDVDQDAKALQG